MKAAVDPAVSSSNGAPIEAANGAGNATGEAAGARGAAGGKDRA